MEDDPKSSPPKIGGNVLINGRTAVHAGSSGVLTSVDVCLTKVGKSTVPIPYTNVARSEDAAQTASTVFINGRPVCHKNSIFSKSTGDEPGNRKGVRSGTITGKAEFVTASSNVFIEGVAAVRQGDYMVSNNCNTAPIPLSQPGAPRPRRTELEDIEGVEESDLENVIPLQVSGSALHIQNDLISIAEPVEEESGSFVEARSDHPVPTGSAAAPGAIGTQPDNQEPSPAKPELVIGVFFDGTGNNMLAQPPDRHTNVAKLHDMYFPEHASDLYKERIYVEGVGTKAIADGAGDYEIDLSLIGLATGLGTYGAGVRLGEARQRFLVILNEYRQAYGQPEKVTFDIFGFSRGAILARHFANMIQAGLPDLQQPPQQGTMSIRPNLRSTEIETPGGRYIEDDRNNTHTVSALYPRLAAEVRIRFIGLFDSVGSFFMPGNNDEGFLNPHLGPDTADFVYQLTARDEIRKNFPLTRILPGKEGWYEEEMFGVHSDVGGGYDNVPERIFIEEASEWYEPMDEINDRPYPPEHEQQWRSNMQQKANSISRQLGIECQVDFSGNTAYFFEIRRTRNDLAKVALKAMHKVAVSKGLPLRSVDPQDAFHPELAILVEQGKAGDPTALKKLDDDYIHTSHRKFCLAYIRETIGMKPETDRQREIYPNQPDQAVTVATKALRNHA